MLSGKSGLHVEQGIGKAYSKKEIKGYYNDLTNKVNSHNLFDQNGIPLNVTGNNKKIYFPITIMQYALGNYDMYLLTRNTHYFNKFVNLANWAIANCDNNGGWDVSEVLKNKYSAMAQGEGLSVLSRAYVETKNEQYLNIAVKGINLMIKPIKEGGTARYMSEKIYFEESAGDKTSLILNGWIFAIFGLFDFMKLPLENKNKYKNILSITLRTLEDSLEKYDCGFWSYYDQCGHLTSPFYHKLHIAQLDVLYDLFDIKKFNIFRNKWKDYLINPFKRNRAVIIKVIQKMQDPGDVILTR